MTFTDYQREAAATAMYPDIGQNLAYPTLGLCGEAGEVAEKIKKYMRDGRERIGSWEELRQTVRKELGDVLWYVSAVANELDLSLQDIATANIEKLQSRKARGVISGSGDDR